MLYFVQSSGFAYSFINRVVLGIYKLDASIAKSLGLVRIGFFFIIFLLFHFDYNFFPSFQKYKTLVTSFPSWNCTKKPIETHYLLYLWFLEVGERYLISVFTNRKGRFLTPSAHCCISFKRTKKLSFDSI